MKEKTVYIDSQSDYEMLEDLIFDYAATLGQGKTVRVVFGKTEVGRRRQTGYRITSSVILSS